MRSQGGFTLFELLGAIGLLGLLLLLIAGTFSAANKTVESTSRFANRLEEVRAGQRFLLEALQNIKPVALIPETDQLFDGGADHLRFIAAIPTDLGGKLTIHQLDTFKTNSGKLELRVVFFERNGNSWGQPQVLMHHVRRVQFRYRGLDEKYNRTGWLDQWPWPQRLPESIQLLVEADGPLRWPMMTVSMRVGHTQGKSR